MQFFILFHLTFGNESGSGLKGDTDDDAFVYDMKDVIDLYVNSEYEIHVSPYGKIVVSLKVGDKKEIFYLEIRGSLGKCGSMNHGVRAPKLYSFLQENLKCEIIPA